MYNNVELRKVPASILDPIAQVLETNEDWKTLMDLIPKDIKSNNSPPKYNKEHVGLIEAHAKETKKKCAMVLFDEWGCDGMFRPTLQTLKDLLIKANMIRASDDLALLLNEKPPPRPVEGPGAAIDTNVTSLLNKISEEQDISTRQVTDTTRESFSEHGETQPTYKMESIPDLMDFTKTIEAPDFNKMMIHDTDMIPNERNALSDFLKFTENQQTPATSNLDYPRFSQLLNGLSSNAQDEYHSSSYINSQRQDTNTSNMQTMDSLQVDDEILDDSNLKRFKYSELASITKNFSRHADFLIGKGGFGEVFKGNHEKYGSLAIKRVRNMENLDPEDIVNIFNTEVRTLALLRHKNVVPILGYSIDSPAYCIVCEYIAGGSLFSIIKKQVLNKYHRMNIIKGSAEGLKYIHSTEKPILEPQRFTKKAYFLHGDVKSANILLTADFTPMLCDFGLSRHCSTTTTHRTRTVVGTEAYMAPERRAGTVTQKADIYSFGVVLLELLTGAEPVISEGSEQKNIKDLVAELCHNGEITPALDPMIQDWTNAQSIYELSKRCLLSRELRPSMNEICDILINMNEPEDNADQC